MSLNIKEFTKAVLIRFQDIPQVFFNPYPPEFSPDTLTYGTGWPYLPARARSIHMSHVLTNTAASNTATPADITSRKINSNYA